MATGIAAPPVQWHAVFSPDGRYLAIYEQPDAPYDSGTVCIWEVASGQIVRKVDGIRNLFLSPLFSPDGRALVHGHACTNWNQSGHTENRRSICLFRDLLTLEAPRLVGDGPDFVCLGTGEPVRSFDGHLAPVTCIAFSTNGQRLATGSWDQSILIWNAERPPSAKLPALTDQELKALWRNLASAQAPRAYEAAAVMISRPEQAVAFVKQTLAPPPVLPAARVDQFIQELDDEQFTVRQRAAKELEALGDRAEEALRKALKRENASVESHRRITELINRLDAGAIPFEKLQRIRGTTVLERIATPDASRLLEHLADLESEAWFHHEVQASLKRLRARDRR
jgi:hypothetical protein